MNIGFDLDKVFIDYPPFIPSSIIDRLYKKKRKKKLIYRIPNKVEQLLRHATHLPPFRPAIKENLLALNSHSKKNKHNLFLISSRFSFLKGKTSKIVEKHKFEKIFKRMFFNYENQQPHVFKSKTIKKLKIKKYIDDDLELLEYLVENNKETTFYWLNKKIDKKLKNNLIAITDIKKFLK